MGQGQHLCREQENMQHRRTLILVIYTADQTHACAAALLISTNTLTRPGPEMETTD